MTIPEMADVSVIAEGDRLAVEEPVGEAPPEQATRQTRAATTVFRTLLVLRPINS